MYRDFSTTFSVSITPFILVKTSVLSIKRILFISVLFFSLLFSLLDNTHLEKNVCACMCVCVCVCVRACFRRHNIALSGFLAIFTLFFFRSKKKKERVEKEKEEKRQEWRKRRKRKKEKVATLLHGCVTPHITCDTKIWLRAFDCSRFLLFSVFLFFRNVCCYDRRRFFQRPLRRRSIATKKRRKKEWGKNGRNYKSRRGIETVESFFD